MKYVLKYLVLFFISTSSFAAVDWGSSCSTIKTIRAWQGGSDQYGLRIEFEAPYAGCEGGFFIPHAGANKQYVYSTALTAYTANLLVCIQIPLVSESIGNVCKVNAITLTK